MTNKKLNNIIICYMKLKQYCQQLESKLVEMEHVWPEYIIFPSEVLATSVAETWPLSQDKSNF